MKENIFNEMARRYDNEERIELANIITKKVREKLQQANEKSLLDYGSGTGLVSLQLTDLVKSVLLVDSSKQMLEISTDKIERAEIPNAEVLHADFTKDVPGIKTDIILVSLVLLHVPNTKKLLDALFEILTEDGLLLIVDFDKNNQINHPRVHNGFEQSELKALLNEIGFQTTEIETFYHGENIFMKKDASMFLSSSIK